MRVQVTKEDIKGGKRYSPSCCPIARAIQRTLGKADIQIHGCAQLGLRSWYFKARWIHLRMFLFDWTGYMRPFSFKLESF